MLLERGLNVNVMLDIKFSRRSGMVLSWFNASGAKEFGASLARFYIERIPPGDAGGKNKPTAKKQQEVVNKMFQQMARFKLEHKLNIYKKAQMGNAFKWALKDAGYADEFVDHFTKELMLKC
ncbi:hypothetical protein [Sulfurimicrobium lacus]|nr:hypothetical protein [Sulfurimicrobium lacus]